LKIVQKKLTKFVNFLKSGTKYACVYIISPFYLKSLNLKDRLKCREISRFFCFSAMSHCKAALAVRF